VVIVNPIGKPIAVVTRMDLGIQDIRTVTEGIPTTAIVPTIVAITAAINREVSASPVLDQ